MAWEALKLNPVLDHHTLQVPEVAHKGRTCIPCPSCNLPRKPTKRHDPNAGDKRALHLTSASSDFIWVLDNANACWSNLSDLSKGDEMKWLTSQPSMLGKGGVLLEFADEVMDCRSLTLRDYSRGPRPSFTFQIGWVATPREVTRRLRCGVSVVRSLQEAVRLALPIYLALGDYCSFPDACYT